MATRGAEQDMDEFSSFMARYKKVYFNEEELAYRRSLFELRKAEAEAHNEKKLGWTKGINRFSDLSDWEFRTRHLGYKRHSMEGKVQLKQRVGGSAPESVDWKAKGAVTGIKDQGTCGSCWAFSTVGGVEGAYFLARGTLLSFSEQQLVDCAGQSFGNAGCDGGDLPGSFKYYEEYGVETETSYPYMNSDQVCHSEADKMVAKVKNYAQVEQYSDEALKEAVSEQPVSVCIDSSHLGAYSGGVVDVATCGPNAQIDHCVLLYGYKGDEYWMLKNSWGTWWGEEGYFRFAQGGDTCCI